VVTEGPAAGGHLWEAARETREEETSGKQLDGELPGQASATW
jgi:hypothetical protein